MGPVLALGSHRKLEKAEEEKGVKAKIDYKVYIKGKENGKDTIILKK